MPAGDSAGAEARRQSALADAHQRAAVEARETAARYSLAEETERRTATVLAPLSAVGYHLLADRRWPGSTHAQVDLVVVGPGGLFIVDTKAWAEVSIADERVYRGQADVTDELCSLADLRAVDRGGADRGRPRARRGPRRRCARRPTRHRPPHRHGADRRREGRAALHRGAWQPADALPGRRRPADGPRGLPAGHSASAGECGRRRTGPTPAAACSGARGAAERGRGAGRADGGHARESDRGVDVVPPSRSGEAGAP
jgi:hypothetical protein